MADPASDPAVLFMSAFGIAGVVAGIVMIAAAFRSLRERRRVESFPTSAVRSMALGPVELNGVIAPGLEVPDPVYARPCVDFSVSVAHRVLTKTDAGVGWEWVGIHHERTGQRPFWLADGTGTTLVWAPDADFRFDRVSTYSCGFLGSLFGGSSPSLDFLRRVKKQRVFIRRVRYALEVLRPGQPVFVLGNAVSGDGFRPRDATFADVLKAALQQPPRRIVTKGDGDFIVTESERTATQSRGGMSLRVVLGFCLIAASLGLLGFFWFLFQP